MDRFSNKFALISPMQIWQRKSYRRWNMLDVIKNNALKKCLDFDLSNKKNENKTRIHISAHSLDGCEKNVQLIVWKVTVKLSMRNKSIPETLALIKPKKKCVWFVSHLSHPIFSVPITSLLNTWIKTRIIYELNCERVLFMTNEFGNRKLLLFMQINIVFTPKMRRT